MTPLSPAAIARFPNVCNTARRTNQTFCALAECYTALPAETLMIRAILGTPYAPAVDGRLHLDSILSYAAVASFPVAPSWGDEPAIIPLPIEPLWVSQDGLPLWACSDLYLNGPAHSDVEYWHKRYPAQRMQDWADKPNAPTTRGRYKEYRIPVRVVMPENATLYSLAYGHADSIRNLLQYVQFVGKKPAQGKGRVVQWEVQPVELPASECLAEIIRRKSVPVEYLPPLAGERLSLRSGWTPPYWYRPWHGQVRMPV